MEEDAESSGVSTVPICHLDDSFPACEILPLNFHQADDLSSSQPCLYLEASEVNSGTSA